MQYDHETLLGLGDFCAARRSPTRLPAACIVAIFAFCSPAPSGAQSRLPPEHEAALLTKVLKFDRTIKTRAGDALDIVLLHRAGSDDFAVMEKAFGKLAGQKFSGVPFKVSAMKLARVSDVDAIAADADVLFLCAGLNDYVSKIVALAKGRGIITLGGGGKYIEEGVLLGVSAIEGRAKLLVNAAAAKESRISFDSRLYGVAKVIQ